MVSYQTLQAHFIHIHIYLIGKYSVSTGGLKAVWERDLGIVFDDNDDDWDTLVEEILLP